MATSNVCMLGNCVCNTLGFKTVRLLKDQVLGIGSYGKVCKAQCDDLVCAAKLLHETLFVSTPQQLFPLQREHRLPMRRFEQECQFLSTIRHPNIVQYLGLFQDPDTGLPALLMELMDDSLTHSLESSTQPIPYHMQVNICHDIALALSFLHSHDIIHRDLSSNNVLLIGNVRAKVTDFGMARLCSQSPHAPYQQCTFTVCPGTDVFMPPEAVQDKPVYTEKIDCFSFGVISLQILTQKFPRPGDCRRQMCINQPGIPSGTVVEVLIPEVERRQNHIAEVDPNHPLLPVILDCVKDKDTEHPSAQKLCEILVSLMESQQYSESKRVAQERNLLVSSHELEQLKNVAREEIERLQSRLHSTLQQIEDSEWIVRKYQRRINELELQVPTTDAAAESGPESSTDWSTKSITWREGEKAPCAMSTRYNAVTTGNELYIRTVSREVYAYTASNSSWSQFPDSPTQSCPSVIINGLLTLVGGQNHGGTAINKLFSLTGESSDRRWSEVLPHMPTKRYSSIALCHGPIVIVAGGLNGIWTENQLQTVELLNTETLQWSTAADLPRPRTSPPGAICGDRVYILSQSICKNMYTCSIGDLIQSCSLNRRADVWKSVAAPPVAVTTCVSIHGQLVTIGGKHSNRKPTTAIYTYTPHSNSWEVIGHMSTPRFNCHAAVFPADNKLIIVGGRIEGGATDSVEIAAVL